jgi:hypothetical protein
MNAPDEALPQVDLDVAMDSTGDAGNALNMFIPLLADLDASVRAQRLLVESTRQRVFRE